MAPIPQLALAAPPRLAAWLLLLLLSGIGGTTFLWIEVALSDFGPLRLVAYRISLAAVVMLVIWQSRGGKLFDGAVSRATICALVSICFLTTILPFLLISWGQQYVTSGFASIALASSALIVSPLAHLLVPGERMSMRSTVGLIFGFMGVVFLISPAWQTGISEPQFILGELACVLAAGCYALSSVFISRLPPVDPIGLTAVTLSIAGIVVFLAALLFAEPMTRPGRSTTKAVPWERVFRFEADARRRVIVLGGAKGTLMRVYCPDGETYERALGCVRERTTGARLSAAERRST